MPKRLYLANPYGFSAQQKAAPLAALVDALPGDPDRLDRVAVADVLAVRGETPRRTETGEARA